MVDPDRGWRTERLTIEPLVRAHAAELSAVLDDQRLHEFVGGSPLSPAALADRYARLETRRSADGAEVWANWVLRERRTGLAMGTVQATLPAAGPASGPAQVAWVLASAFQGRGYAAEAAAGLVERLAAAGWTVEAFVHPGHAASQAVARRVGLRPTADLVDGEVRWVRPPATPPADQAPR